MINLITTDISLVILIIFIFVIIIKSLSNVYYNWYKKSIMIKADSKISNSSN